MSDDLKNKIVQVIKTHPKLADFEGEMPERKVLEAEERLGVTFPPEFRWFCKSLGCGDFDGCEFYGIVNGEAIAVPSIIFYNERARTFGVPKDILLFMTEGDIDYGLDLQHVGEPVPVIEYNVGEPMESQPNRTVADSFLEFLHQKLRNSIDYS